MAFLARDFSARERHKGDEASLALCLSCTVLSLWLFVSLTTENEKQAGSRPNTLQVIQLEWVRTGPFGVLLCSETRGTDCDTPTESLEGHINVRKGNSLDRQP